MAKYLATSFEMLKVVSEPRVINSCLPISTISISLVGLLSRSIMLAASRAGWVPVFMATATSACARAGASFGAVPGHRYQPTTGLVLADQRKLGFRSGLRQEVIYPGFRGNRCGGQGIIAGDHDGLDPHVAQVGKALFDAAFDDIFRGGSRPGLRRSWPPPGECRRCEQPPRRSSAAPVGQAYPGW